MISLFNIWMVAKYETKTLYRSWFFRIFTGLSVGLLLFFTVMMFCGVFDDVPWIFRAVSSFIPYFNILFLNLAQAILVIFLASDFLRRDKKLDTTEVIYMRAMTNGDYVLGKTIGILMIFFAVNILLMFIIAILQIVFSDANFNVTAYLLYPLLFSLPTLVFILGLSYVFMIVIRNQAVTFIILLGYIALILFFVGQKWHGIWDYTAFYMPMTISDFVGLSNADHVLLQRAIYLSFGLSFIFITVLILPRLPQSKSMRRFSWVSMTLLMVAAIASVVTYTSRFGEGKKLRRQMVQLNEKWMQQPHARMTMSRLDVDHRGNELNVVNKVVLKNTTEKPIDQYIFSLNPGLEVSRVAFNNKGLNFSREHHLLFIQPTAPLQIGAIDSFEIHYAGKINEEACYADLSERIRDQNNRVWIYRADKRYGFIDADYVLLTSESLWYPVPGVPYDPVLSGPILRDFTYFQLKVKTRPGLTVISQGHATAERPGSIRFIPEQPMPQISLVIGAYKKRAIEVDSVQYALYTLPKHDYFVPYFSALGDTIVDLIREGRRDYESNLNLEYAYPRLSLIEVPVQFVGHERFSTVASEWSQPEQLFIPENGSTVDWAAYRNQAYRIKRGIERSNQVITEQEKQSRLFRGFVVSPLQGNVQGRMSRENLVNLTAFTDIFPIFYSYKYQFVSVEWPLFNTALEAYLHVRATGQGGAPFFRMFSGLSDEEKALLALKKQTLTELILDDNPDRRNVVIDALRLKGEFLFKGIENAMGSEPFTKFLFDYVKEHPYEKMRTEDFADALAMQDVSTDFNAWQSSRSMPGFKIWGVQAHKVLDGDRTRFQVLAKVANLEPVNGLVSISFRTGGPGRRFFGSERERMPEYLYHLDAMEAKEIGIVLDQSPSLMSINTLVSQNLPQIITQNFRDLELRDRAQPFHGERITELPPEPEDEYIVDNEDDGFSISGATSESMLKRLLPKQEKRAEEKYRRFRFWSLPSQWQLTTLNEFYGKYIHSAYHIRAGGGSQKAAWQTDLKQSGQYDVYYYIARIPQFFGRRRGGRSETLVGQLHFTAYYDDGSEEIVLEAEGAEEGWNLLTTQYFAAGPAKVELSDETNGRLVYADAVRWVKR